MKFLKSRQDKMTAKDGMVEGDMEHPVVGEDEEEDSHASSNQTTDQLVPPKGWVHMDVVEREKLEWMTDVAPPSAQPDLDKNKTRFSLDGLVIPRSTAIPMHLGLHHHGDEPEVILLYTAVDKVHSVRQYLFKLTSKRGQPHCC